MAGLSAGTLGTTFNLPNYNGILFNLTPHDTPFSSAIGVLSGGGEMVDSKDFEWQTYDLRASEIPAHLEGQAAPASRARVRANVSNVVQILHSTVEVSYTKLAATGQRDGLNNGQNTAQANEMNWQVEQELKGLKLDIEKMFLTGTYAKPSDNTAARKTRGLIPAITTNVVANGSPAALTETMVLDLMQSVWTNGGITEQETATLMVNAKQKRALTKIFVTDKNYQETTRNMGGVSVQTIETDFGRVNIMLNRHMPVDTLVVASLEVCKPKFLLIPEKGFLFLEPLAKTGASEKAQIYGELGLEYGAELQHGKITNLS
jgi:hypothetical protein